MKGLAYFLRYLLLLLVLGAAWAQDLRATAEGRELVFNSLVEVFREFYWDEERLDWDTWAAQYRDQALNANDFDSVARQMVRAVGDDHSRWVGRVQYVEDAEALSQAQPGLGISHDFIEGNGILVLRVFPETPAAESGLKRGDVIIRVNGEDARSFSGTRGVGELLTSAIRTGEVKLLVRRKTELLQLSVTPQAVDLEFLRDMPQAEMLDAEVAYLYLPSFDHAGIGDRVHTLLAELKEAGAKALILDMRGNLGGRLSELGLILGAFMEGNWAQAVSRNNLAWQANYELFDGVASSWLQTPDGRRLSQGTLAHRPVRFDGPLVVLVNSDNNSAGEVAPLVLQASGRAKVVGEPTFGNVEAIRGFDLPDGSMVLVAVANIQGAGGESFDRGLTPDLIARETRTELARGFDAPVAEALRLLRELPFTPGKFF